jgi:hypothetical protein
MALAAKCDRADRALDDVGINLDAAVVEEAGGTVPPNSRIDELLPCAYAATTRSNTWPEDSAYRSR